MLENLVVGIVVAGAFVYAIWALSPARLRAGMAARIGAWGRGPGRSKWLARTAGAIERAGQSGDACGRCSASAPARPDPDRGPPEG